LTAFVLDASTVLAWLLKDTRQNEADVLIRRARNEGASAPRLMALEVPNGLRNRIRRGMLSARERDDLIGDFLQLPIEWDDEADVPALVRASERHDLTIYDAAYLDLATRRGIALATLDERLAKAARVAGLALIP